MKRFFILQVATLFSTILLACSGDAVGTGLDAGTDAPLETSVADAHPASNLGIGAKCLQDTDCESGLCLNLASVKDGCTSRVCTKPCVRNGECSERPNGECDPSPRGNVCLWEDFEDCL